MAFKRNTFLEFLLTSSDYVTIGEICTHCGISSRTAYNYLKEIQEEANYEVLRSKNGILIKRKSVENKSKIPEDYGERKNWIFRKGLMLQQKISIDKMMDYFIISESTFHSDLIKIRKEIKRFNVKLISKQGYLYFFGNYHDLKRLTQHLIYAESNSKQSLLSIDVLNDVFPNLDVYFIKKTIVDVLKDNNRFMDEYSVINLLLHVLISLNQEINNIVPINSMQGVEVVNEISQICKAIEDKYCFNFSLSAKQQFTLMLTTCTKQSKIEFHDPALKNNETLKITKEIFTKLIENYNLDLDVPMTRQTFILHIDNLLSRIKNGVKINNPLYRIIKQNSPITYDLALYSAKIIYQYTNVFVSESEVGYIALHIGTRIEQIKSEFSKLKTVIVCPEYYTYNTNIGEIEQLFHEDLYVANICNSFDDIQLLKSADLVISTAIPSNYLDDVHVLYISNFLNSCDRKNIAIEIDKVKHYKNNIRSKEIIRDLFDKRLFFKNLDINDKKRVMHYISKQLCELNFVSRDYEEKLFHRENIASTDFNTIAIPHPAEYNANQTVISVAILKNPVLWKRNHISLVFMLAINNADFTIFEDVLSSLIKITSNTSNVKKLIESNDYDSFINNIVNMFDQIESSDY